MFLTPNNGSVMRFAIKNGGDEQQVSYSGKLPSAQWVHVAVTIGNGRASIILNGDEVAYNNNVTIRPSDFRPVFNYIGRSQFNGDPFFAGYIDDLRIYNYALSSDEVKAVMEDLTNGIGDATLQSEKAESRKQIYDLQGRRVSQPVRGISIRKSADGKTQKVIKR